MSHGVLVIPQSSYTRDGGLPGWPETAYFPRRRDTTQGGEWLTPGQATEEHRTPPDLTIPSRFASVLERCVHTDEAWDLLALSTNRQLVGRLRVHRGRLSPLVELHGAGYVDRAFLTAVEEEFGQSPGPGVEVIDRALRSDRGRILCAALLVRAMRQLDEAATLAVSPAQAPDAFTTEMIGQRGICPAEVVIAQRYNSALERQREAGHRFRNMSPGLRYAFVDTLGSPRDETRLLWADEKTLERRASLVNWVEIYDAVAGGYGRRVLQAGCEPPRAFMAQTGRYATGIRIGGAAALLVSGSLADFGRIASIVHRSAT